MKHLEGGPCGVLVRIVCMLQVLMVITAEQNSISGEQLGSKSDRVLFDVSTVVGKLKGQIQSGVLSDINSVQGLEPLHYYFDLKADLSNCKIEMSNQNSQVERKNNHPCAFIDGVAVTVKGNAKVADLFNLSAFVQPFAENSVDNLLQSESPFLKSVIVSFEHASVQNNCPERIRHFSQLIYPKMKGFKRIVGDEERVKIGLELSEPFLKSCKELMQFHFLSIVDQAVLRIDLNCTTAMLSYGLFIEMITQSIDNFKRFIERFDTQPTLFIRLNSSAIEKVAVKGLVTEYLKAWINEEKGHKNQGMFIWSPTLTNFTAAGNIPFLKENLTFGLYAGKSSVFSRKSNYKLRSEGEQVLSKMHSIVDNILLVNPSISLVASYQFADEKQPQSSNEARQGCMSVLITKSDNSSPQVTELMSQLLSNKEKLNLSTIYIDSEIIGTFDKKINSELMQSKGLKIGCFVQMKDQVAKKCGGLWNVSIRILMNVSLDIKSEQNLIQLLSTLQTKKSAMEMQYPNKSVVPMLRIASIYLKVQRHKSLKNFVTLQDVVYCRGRIKRWNEYYQVILTFARIHQWSDLVLMPASNSHNDFVLWRNAETDESIDRSATNFPLLYRANSEKSLSGENLPMTYPCIDYTEEKAQDINFLKSQLSGTTFSAKLRNKPPLKCEELQKALLYALKRFPFVELREANEHELNQIDDVISQKFLDKIKSSRKEHVDFARPLIYFEIALPEAARLKENIRNLLAERYQGITAVHISNWENSTEQQLKDVLSIVEAESALSNFGVVIQNCTHEMNMGLANLKSRPFINLVSYLVCNVRPVLPSNANAVWMQQYLDTLFYTKSYMEQSLSSNSNFVEVIFRINFDSTARNCPDPNSHRKRFSFFLNDVSQHSASFQIKYFIVPAFERQMLKQQCQNTWWHITNYNDLTNKSAYVNNLRRNGTQPKRITPHSSGDSNTSTYLMTILPISALVLLGAFLLWFQRQYYQKSFLTQREVDNFYKANVISGEGMKLASTDEPNCEYIKFPDNYEISARDIEIQEEVGRGQFGVVHVGRLKKYLEVAIKIPRSDCTKEEFISALSELKILCYVGTHPNIVSFLGAHTKNIRRGKLLIVTEFCGNGSLESYLRGLASDGRHDLNQLYEFAHQIAAGMEYLAEKRIIHGDLATRNVLLTTDFTCKISDFGLSRRLYEVSVYVKRGNEALPWMWMAPESLRDMEFTTKSDVWSYAVTLWEIFTLGKLPYPGRCLTHAFIMELESGIRMDRAKLASQMIHEKMLECWSLAPEDRPTFTELKQYFGVLGKHLYQNTSMI